MKKYAVTLDPSKCVSYTLSDGRKFLPGRTRIMEEGEIAPFKDAGVFLIYVTEGDTPASDEKSKVPAGFKRKKPVSPEVNHEEKVDEEGKSERTEE